MHRRGFIKTACTLLLCAGSGQLAFADQQALDQSRLTRLLDIVDKVGVIIPGQGFKSIKIGDSAARLVQLWGQPKAVEKRGKLLAYQLDQRTVILFQVKKKLIDKIVVQGKSGSLAHVNNGVVFGMTPQQTASQFPAQPENSSAKRLHYPQLGIELGFPQGRLTEILIFSPR